MQEDVCTRLSLPIVLGRKQSSLWPDYELLRKEDESDMFLQRSRRYPGVYLALVRRRCYRSLGLG
jgi:hypothetical protein